jgi:hypothetical protein
MYRKVSCQQLDGAAGIVVDGMLRFSAMSERRRRPLGTHLSGRVYGHVPGYN